MDRGTPTARIDSVAASPATPNRNVGMTNSTSDAAGGAAAVAAPPVPPSQQTQPGTDGSSDVARRTAVRQGIFGEIQRASAEGYCLRSLDHQGCLNLEKGKCDLKHLTFLADGRVDTASPDNAAYMKVAFPILASSKFPLSLHDQHFTDMGGHYNVLSDAVKQRNPTIPAMDAHRNPVDRIPPSAVDPNIKPKATQGDGSGGGGV